MITPQSLVGPSHVTPVSGHRGAAGAKGAPERWALRPAGVAAECSGGVLTCAPASATASLRADETPLCGHLYGRMTCTRAPHLDHPHGHVYASSDGSAVPDRHHEPEDS